MPKASTDTARELARLSTDCSFLLTHMVRQNGEPQKTDDEAKRALQSILRLSPVGGPILKGGKVGWYGAVGANSFDPVTSTFNSAPACRAVCFTESTLTGLRAHRQVFGVKYGVAFDRDWLFGRGANPCLNIRQDILKADLSPLPGENFNRKVYHYIPPWLHPFVNVINDSFDATHEREWRQPDDLTFTSTDLRFVFCPEREFGTFSGLQNVGLPTLFDLDWLDRV